MIEAGPPYDLKRTLTDMAAERNRLRERVRELEEQLGETNRALMDLEAAHRALEKVLKRH